MDDVLVAPLRAAASVMVSAQTGKLRCAGDSADYLELLTRANVQEIVAFMRQEVMRLSFGTRTVRLFNPSDLGGGGWDGGGLYLEAYTPEMPDPHSLFYVIRILNDPNNPGLEIELVA